MRMDTVKVHCSAERSTVSLQSISLSAIKALTDNMELCCPASQTPNPVLKLTEIAFSYFIPTHTLQVLRSPSDLFLWTEVIFLSIFLFCVSFRFNVKRSSLLSGRRPTTWSYTST